MASSPTAIFEELDAELKATANADPKPTTTDPQPDPATATAAAPDPATAIQNSEAAKQLEALAELGITPANAQQFVNNGKMTAQLGYYLKENPEQFLNMLEQNDPASFKNLIDKSADAFLKRNPIPPEPGKANSNIEPLANELREIKGKISVIEQKEAAKEQAAFTASVQTKYTAEVDKYVNHEALKDMSAWDKESLRAKIDLEIGRDQKATQLINSGVYTPIGKAFKAQYDKWKAQHDTANGKTHEDLKKVQANGNIGSEIAAGVELPAAASGKPEDSWENTENYLTGLLNKAVGKK